MPQTIPAPPLRSDLWKELRTFEEFPKLALSWPILAMQPRGKGEPVLVLPGFGASDVSTRLLRRYLEYLGYDVRGWGLGRNHGNVRAMLPRVVELIEAITTQHEMPLRLVGWSLGGYLAREAARERQHLVHQVITLGSPVVGGPKFTQVAAYYRQQGYDISGIEAAIEARYTTPLNVPVTAIYSRRDGIVSWEACIDNRSPNVEHVEVDASHLGLGFSAPALRLIARRLAR